jgi:hypothetical protein
MGNPESHQYSSGYLEMLSALSSLPLPQHAGDHEHQSPIFNYSPDARIGMVSVTEGQHVRPSMMYALPADTAYRGKFFVAVCECGAVFTENTLQDEWMQVTDPHDMRELTTYLLKTSPRARPVPNLIYPSVREEEFGSL